MPAPMTGGNIDPKVLALILIITALLLTALAAHLLTPSRPQWADHRRTAQPGRRLANRPAASPGLQDTPIQRGTNPCPA